MLIVIFKKLKTGIINFKYKLIGTLKKPKTILLDKSGQGTLDTEISVVLGALILGGLYLLIKGTVLPTITPTFLYGRKVGKRTVKFAIEINREFFALSLAL